MTIGDFIEFLSKMQYPVTHLTVVVPSEDVVIEIGNECALPRIYTLISDYEIDTFNSDLNTKEGIATAYITIVAHKKQEE